MDYLPQHKHRFGHDASASIAVEFALIAPIFILMLFGLICFAITSSIASGVQQLASESARASVAGLSDTERTQIVQSFVNAHVGAYPFVLPQKLAIATAGLVGPNASFQVTLTYDLSNQAVSALGTLVPFVPTQIRRSAVVLSGSSL